MTTHDRFDGLGEAFRAAPDVSWAIRRGRLQLRVDGRIFAVWLGRAIVVSLPPSRAAALRRAGAAVGLDPGPDTLLPGWVVVASRADGSHLLLAHEACEHARSMSSRGRRCRTWARGHRPKGGTMAAPFVWFDLETTQESETLAFYSELLQWETAGGAGAPTMVKGAEGPWASVAESSDGSARWIPYVQVADVDAAAEKAGRLGGSILRPKMSGPAGEFAVVADPAGARIALWQPAAA